MKTKSSSKQSKTVKQRPTKAKRAAAGAQDSCGYKQKWSVLDRTDGYVPVWIPAKLYDKAAAAFLKKAKEKYQKKMLRQRMAPLGLEWTCTGSCYGGWCREKMIFDGGSSHVYVCECDYFV